MSGIEFLPLELGNILLGGLWQVLLDRLMPHFRLLDLFVSDKEVGSEVKEWFSKLAIIQAVLGDAEEKQWTNTAVKRWLDDLRDFVYDLEDQLDEDLRLDDQSGLKKWWQNIKAMSASRDLTNRLEVLCQRRSLLGLIERTTGGISTAVWQRPPSTCLLTEPDICGREKDKSNILEMMSSNESTAANFRVISIVGMAGVGKTTLAKQVYNDTSGLTDFDRKVWICVSNDFDVFKISKTILESITHSTCELKDLNEVQVQLKFAVSGRRFLLVLDDVWSKNYDLWETLKSPFLTGARGSRIIVTSRWMDVALTMGGPRDCYNLELLSDDHCWSVFQMHAFENRNVDDAHPNLESVREKVVQKCGGLPLAARTLGGLLRSKQRYDEWEDILNSQIWDLPEDSNILPVLKLSYYHLPSHLKRCFAYCSILPKNYEFEQKEVVLLWIAEGLILTSANSKRSEDIGGEYFRNLLSRSIFHRSSGDDTKFVMHNLFNDLAQWVSGEISFRLEDEIGANRQLRRLERARHFSYRCGNFDGKSKLPAPHEGSGHLRTFLPILTHNPECCYISKGALSDFLSKFKKLRVLSLRNYQITEVHDSIEKLSYLRYLNLADTKIRSLPDWIGSLINLHILILRNCSDLLELPSEVGKLINLHHLDIEGVDAIKKMPSEIRKLINLERLSNFIVSESSEFGLINLKNLKLLGGELRISQLEKVIDLKELSSAILSDKKLEELILEWGSVFDNSRIKDREINVLDRLRPHANLKKLTINHYGGSTFPSWIDDPSFFNMVVIRLKGCVNCVSLPSLGCLPKLKEVTISQMTQLTTIDSGFYGSSSKPFQSLEILRFEDLKNWSHWYPFGDNVDDKVFDRLGELSIVKCPQLSGTLPEHLPSLQKLVIQQCAQLEVSFSTTPMQCEVEINERGEIKYTDGNHPLWLNSMSLSNSTPLGNWFRRAFQKVNELKVKCPRLYIIPQSSFLSSLSGVEIEDCSHLTSLQGIIQQSACLNRLVIRSCDSLTSIATGRQLPKSLKRLKISSCEKLKCVLDDGATTRSQMHESFLEYLYVSQCPALQSLSSTSQLAKRLQHLEIHNCSELTTLGQLPDTLKRLEIKTCGKLNSLSSSSSGHFPTSLEYLSINNCPIEALSLTAQFPLSLQDLNIESCSQLKRLSSSGQLPTSLKHLKVNNCINLNSIADSLQNLSSLREIDIIKCRSLKKFPDHGLPKSNLTLLSIRYCKHLVALPSSKYTLNSLQELHILHNSNFTSLSPFNLKEEGFPINLTSLSITITSPQFYGQVMERLHELTSLRKLHIIGCQDANYFPVLQVQELKKKIVLPTSLTSLTLENFSKLKSLSPEGLKNLISLEYLSFSRCPKLIPISKLEELPSSLLELHVNGCPKYLKPTQSKVANIPYVRINGTSIHEQF